MTPQEAKRILHPETGGKALEEIAYYAGFNGEAAKLQAVNEACIVACEAIEKLERLEKWMEEKEDDMR